MPVSSEWTPWSRFISIDNGPSNPRYQDPPSTVDLATPPRAASPPATSRASETPKAGRSPCLSTAELPQEPGTSSSSGATTPKASQSEGGTSTLSRYSKLSLGFPPLPGFFRTRNSHSVLQPSAKPATETAEEPPGDDAVVDITADSSEDAGSGHAGKPEDDDDRRTIKGVIINTAEPSATPELKQDGNVQGLSGATSAEEKLSDATSLAPVVSVDSFI